MTTTKSQSTTTDDVVVHLILTGASGYLGQHLLSHWITEGLPRSAMSASTTAATASNVKYRITALYNRLEGFPDAVKEYCRRQDESSNKNTNTNNDIFDVTVRSIDLTDSDDIESFINSSLMDTNTSTTSSTIVTIVVHTAAMSSPRLCEENPERAQAINVPVKFFNAILSSSSQSSSTSIIALSTDQVYDGKQDSNSYYKEDETEGLNPVNVYGRTKLEMEEYLLQKQKQSKSSLLFALRSSIILGPKAPIDPKGAHGTFLDFVKSRGESADQEPTTFFTNEYRSVVRVDRVLQTINGIITNRILSVSEDDDGDDNEANTKTAVVFNMGGSVRVNRMDMAKAVFDKFGYNHKLLLLTKQTSPMSPLDISMDSSLLFKYGIIGGEGGHANEQEQQQPEAYLKELVEYAFAVE